MIRPEADWGKPEAFDEDVVKFRIIKKILLIPRVADFLKCGNIE
jgi:hypothetical protein